jgi:hypothetical protein
MDLETAASTSARHDSRRRILRAAIHQRRAELRQDWQRHITVKCLNELGSNATKVASVLSGQDAFHDWRVATTSKWQDCAASLPECLISVGLGETIACHPSTAEPTPLSSADLKRLSGKDRVQALCARYRCPLNISAKSESTIAEELLRQLMVADRVKLEREADFDVDDVLLKLNLTAICAWTMRDLRFLDALNYFYELPQRSLVRLQRNPQLLASWLCIYAQLLCAPDW